MRRWAGSWLIATVWLLMLTPLAGAQSLGDVARAQKDNPGTSGPAKVYTNDDFPSGQVIPEPPVPPTLSAQRAPSKAGSPPGVSTLRAETPNGWSVDLAPDDSTDLVFMATWCRHSKALKGMLNDPRSHPYWAGKKLVFLFSKNEWAHAKHELQDAAKRGMILENDIPAKLEELKRQAGSPYLINPTFLNDLPGAYYFCEPTPEVTAYPKVLSLRGSANGQDWLVRNLQMPEKLYQDLKADYDPGSSSRFLPQWAYGGYPNRASSLSPSPNATAGGGSTAAPATTGKNNPRKEKP